MDTIEVAHTLRVLVVDDNEDAADSLAMMLELMGFETASAHNGTQALLVALNFLPNVVFLDLGMPGMSGFDVARELRIVPGLESVVIAALTAWGDPTIRARTKASGFNAHLQKPAQMDELVQVCTNAAHR